MLGVLVCMQGGSDHQKECTAKSSWEVTNFLSVSQPHLLPVKRFVPSNTTYLVKLSVKKFSSSQHAYSVKLWFNIITEVLQHTA